VLCGHALIGGAIYAFPGRRRGRRDRRRMTGQLTVFQTTDQRPGGAVMKSVSHELSPSSIASVAAYFQSLTNASARKAE
jgi:cytochrome c553